MKKIALLVVAAALLFAACAEPTEVVVQPAGSGAAESTGITVSGEGRVTGRPDTLTVNIGVLVLRDSVDQALADAAARAEAVIAAVRDAGVAEEDVQTTNFSVYPEYDYRQSGQVLLGYRVSNQVEVKIRDLGRAGAIIDAAVAAGGDESVVQGVSFSLEDNEALVAAARTQAMDKALATAQQLADAAGVALGAPLSIVESFSTQPPPIPYFEAADEGGAERATTPISPGELAVTVVVNVRYAISG